MRSRKCTLLVKVPGTFAKVRAACARLRPLVFARAARAIFGDFAVRLWDNGM